MYFAHRAHATVREFSPALLVCTGEASQIARIHLARESDQLASGGRGRSRGVRYLHYPGYLDGLIDDLHLADRRTRLRLGLVPDEQGRGDCGERSESEQTQPEGGWSWVCGDSRLQRMAARLDPIGRSELREAANRVGLADFELAEP